MGDPLWAIVIVLVIGVTALLATLAYVRATRGPEDAAGRWPRQEHGSHRGLPLRVFRRTARARATGPMGTWSYWQLL